MAFQFDGDDHEMTEMNLIPLIDIMLVLMVIFLVTASVTSPSIPLSLPKTTAEAQDFAKQTVVISVTKEGYIAWGQEYINFEQLQQRIEQIASNPNSAPILQLKADKDARYETLAQIMAVASQAGLSDLAFISDN